MKKMRNIKKILKEDDLGDMGIGAMIVFIAMVLVAGIAASVLIQTANRLEIQAMQTGQETTEEVATGLGIEDISGENGTFGTWTADSILNITICVSPRSGSKDIDLSNTVVELSDSSNKYLVSYNATLGAAAPAATGVFNTNFPTDATFGIIVLEDADTSCITANPTINQGDHVLLMISTGALFGGLVERTDVWGMVIPESGAPGVFAFRTPASLPNVIYDLY
jgi:flagellin FlaB